jgi:hypothetical protein
MSNISSPELPFFQSVIGFQRIAPGIQYVHDTGLVWENAAGNTSTGAFRPLRISDVGVEGLSLAISGAGVPVNTVSSFNNTTGALLSNQAWTGESESISKYSSVIVAAKSDADGTLHMQFSPDAVNWDSSLSFTVESGVNEVHRLSITRPYYRTVYTNGSNDQGYLRLTTLFGSQNILTSTLNSRVQPDADATVTRSVLMGSVENGSYVNVPVTNEGHLEAAIHGPINPFGSVHTENLLPIFQVDAVYGINDILVRATTGLGGVIVEENAQFVMRTNTSVGGNATLQSRKRLRYRPGQGAVARFTAKFTSGVANSFQVAGIGHAEDGIYFGYSGQNFGILHARAGVREVQTLTLSASATVAGNATIVLNNVPHTIQLSNSANTLRTAYEISTGIYTGWTAQSVGSGVVFLAGAAGPQNAPFLFSGLSTNAAGTFSETRSGVLAIENWTPQSQWNGDTMNGTGYSAVTLDTTKGNVYQIGYQFLGYGILNFQIESAANGNNADWVSVHTVRYPNNNTAPNFRNPSFPFTASAYSYGSTTNLELSTASFAGFIEGQKKLNGPPFTYQESSSAVTASAFRALFTIKNSLTFKGKTNQCVINLINLNASVKHTQPVTIYLLKNADLAGNPNFSQYSTNSCALYDNSATTATIRDNSQLLFSISIAELGQESIDINELGFDLQPGEWVTAAARTASSTANFVSISLNTREDQ